MDLIQFSSSPWCYLFFLVYLTAQINHTNSSILNSNYGEIDSNVDEWRNVMMTPDENELAGRCSLEMFSNNSDAFWACRYQRKFHARNCVFFFFSLELNMLCKGTGFRTQFRFKMRRKKFKLCNIFFATLSPSIYKVATRDFSLINRGTEWTGSGRTGWFWSRWPTPCIILTTPGVQNAHI